MWIKLLLYHIMWIVPQVVDLSHDVRKIKSLTGDHGEHFNRIVTEVELLGQDCELCGKVEDELQTANIEIHADEIARIPAASVVVNLV